MKAQDKIDNINDNLVSGDDRHHNDDQFETEIIYDGVLDAHDFWHGNEEAEDAFFGQFKIFFDCLYALIVERAPITIHGTLYLVDESDETEMIEKWRNAFKKIHRKLFEPFVTKIVGDETIGVPKRNCKSRYANRSRKFPFELLGDV